jgi:phosphoglycolate phosphatase
MEVRKKNYSHIIWDWNGTLLDDVEWCIAQINIMLKKRNIKTLTDISDYHSVFRFPIIEYYKKAGFDLEIEPFEILAKEYINLYHGEGSSSVKLHDDAEGVLKILKVNQISQIILSASEQENLLSQLRPFDIQHYFDEILGISDIYAKSKIEIGLDYLSRNCVVNGVIIGDTMHDYEVSKAMGIDCLLVAHGHQSKETLSSCGVKVFNNLHEVLNFLL